MIRPFDWRDLGLLNRVRNRGLCLEAQLAYTRGPQAVQTALLDIIMPGRSSCTLVVRPTGTEEEPAVGQLSHRTDERFARLAFVSPAETLGAGSGELLIEGLVSLAGEHGAQHLIAEVEEGTATFECLRNVGFGIYARQRIWQSQARPRTDAAAPDAWRPRTSSDDPAIQSLYQNLVPALVQQVESPPSSNDRGLVHWVEGELLGYADVVRGPLGVWTQPYFHPAAAGLDSLLAASIPHAQGNRPVPVYVCVRSYQGGLESSLDHAGLELCAEQAVMVKHIAATVRRPVLATMPALEGTRPEPTAPFTPTRDVKRPREVSKQA